MKKIKFLSIAFILSFFISCESEQELSNIDLPKTSNAKYILTKNNYGLYIKETNSSNNIIEFRENKNVYIFDNDKKEFLNKTKAKKSFPGYFYCFFEGDINNIFNCLQNYVGPSETLYSFDPTVPDNPEGIVIDSEGNFIITMALSGDVVKITRNGERSLITNFDIGTFVPGSNIVGLLGALAIDQDDNLFVSVNAANPTLRGVWKITKDGESSLISQFPPNASLNGIALKDNSLYVADSAPDGKIWKVDIDSGIAEIWADDPLLKIINPEVMAPGPNGIQYYNGEFYVSVPNQDLIVAIELNPDQSSGSIRIVSDVGGYDDFAIDVFGNILATTDPVNTLEKIYPDGTREVILTVDDGLDGPTAAVFGNGFLDSFNLYITNAAFPFFTTTFKPSLIKVELGVPGFDRSKL